MNVANVPVILIPHETVLLELSMALDAREDQLRRILDDPRHDDLLQERLRALKYLEQQVKRIRELTAPTIDVITEEVPPQPTPQASNNDNGNISVP